MDYRTIEAGPECDRLVAEVVGEDPTGTVAFIFNGTKVLKAFRPSTKWQHAMEAAERFGLLRSGEHNWRLYQKGMTSEWCVYPDWVSAAKSAQAMVAAPTGPLAVCRAILALSEEGVMGGKRP